MIKNVNNIYLVGLMGSGKTTVGKLASKKLGKSFIDSDHLIEERTGVRVPLIFEYEGEEGFRKRETKVLEELVTMKNIILATGGGIILEEINQKLLVKNGLVIYLKADYDLLASRLKSDLTRPLLQGVDIKDKLKNLLKERDPIYKSISDYVIETKKKRATDIANEIEIIIKQL
ncbi:MAG: shikimate kinase [Methylophilaceae bacterium]|jgi:shikimate kinase|nr:shikimate kinase [Methylophilaceae bacterium]